MDIIKKMKGIFKTKDKAEDVASEYTEKDPKRKALIEEKAKATKQGKPWVAVLDTQINKDNIKNGFFELDWNNEFIEQLIDSGYKGEKPEQIVDAWFKDIARNILKEQGQNPDTGMGYININRMDDDKSEVS